MITLGRPPLEESQINDIFRKLDPHLKTGLSLYKACLEAQIPTSTVYDLYKENKEFAERIDCSRNYCAVMVGSIITKELERIKAKAGLLPLENNELKLIQMVALHSTTTRDEFEDRSKEEIKISKKPENEVTDDEFRESIFKMLEDTEEGPNHYISQP